MRIDQLTFTRFVSAVLVVICHYGNITTGFFATFINSVPCVVSYFFILSGFVMIVAYKNKEVTASRYYINRFARVYPIYLIALLLVILVRVLDHQRVGITEFLLNLFGLQSWTDTYPLSLNYPAWSLSNEFFFYALFPLLLNFIYKKYSLKKLAIGIGAFWAVSQAILIYIEATHHFEFGTKGWNLLYYFPLFHLNAFLIGNLAGLVFLKMPEKMLTKHNALLFFAFLLLTFALFKYPLPFFYHDGMMAIVYVPLIFLLSKNNSWLSKVLNMSLFVFLGDISYGVYILQYPVYEFCRMFFDWMHWQQNFYIYLGLLILAAGFSFIYIETPLRKYISGRMPLRQQSLAVLSRIES